MVYDSQSNHLTVSQANRLRQQASELLDRLITDREQSERRFAEAGKRDPMKFITGRTALDAAIASTREMIANMDALLERLEGEFEQAEVTATRRPARFQPRPAFRPIVNPVPVIATRAVTPVAKLQ